MWTITDIDTELLCWVHTVKSSSPGGQGEGYILRSINSSGSRLWHHLYFLYYTSFHVDATLHIHLVVHDCQGSYIGITSRACEFRWLWMRSRMLIWRPLTSADVKVMRSLASIFLRAWLVDVRLSIIWLCLAGVRQERLLCTRWLVRNWSPVATI